MKIESSRSASADLFPGLPGNESIVIESEPFGSESVYLVVNDPRCTTNALPQKIRLGHAAAGTFQSVAFDLVPGPGQNQNDDKLDIVIRSKTTGSLQSDAVTSLVLYQNQFVNDVSTALHMSVNDLYAVPKSSAVDTPVPDPEARLQKLETGLKDVKEALDDFDSRTDDLESRIDDLDSRVEDVEDRRR